MSSPFTPSSIPSGSSSAGSPFTPGAIPGSGGGSSSIAPLPNVNTIYSGHPLAMGSALLTQPSAFAGGTWPTANLAILIPFSLPTAGTIQHMAWLNGGAVSGNVDAGIYNEDGTKVVTTGSVAQAGISLIQIASVSGTALVAGSYFLVLCVDNTTAQMQRTSLGNGFLQSCGVQQASAAVPMGATLTLANPANAFCPWVAAGFTAVL